MEATTFIPCLKQLIGVIKCALFKLMGGGTLTWSELSKVILDVETQINRRPLSYIEDDIQLPTLTLSSLLFQCTNQLPEEQPWHVEDQDLRRHAKYLITCKDHLWKRWQRECLAVLRERHNLTHKASNFQLSSGDVVIVKADNKNCGTWPLAIVDQVFPGKDRVICAVQLKTANGILEHPVQHLYPLELQCDVAENTKETPLNPDAPEFRPKRDAATAAKLCIQQIQDTEEEGW